jgi:hypothetical protein
MQIAMTLPTMLPHGRAETLAWCRGIDGGPFSSLAVPERITYTSHSLTVELAAAAAPTERLDHITAELLVRAGAVDQAGLHEPARQLDHVNLVVETDGLGADQKFEAHADHVRVSNKHPGVDGQLRQLLGVLGLTPVEACEALNGASGITDREPCADRQPSERRACMS